MRLKNVLIVVKDIEKSKQFYHDLFGLQIVRDFGENVMLSEGLVLQEKLVWEQLMNTETVAGNAYELFFEERDLDAFLHKVKEHHVEVVLESSKNSWDKRVIRIKDPDGHLIEIAEV